MSTEAADNLANLPFSLVAEPDKAEPTPEPAPAPQTAAPAETEPAPEAQDKPKDDDAQRAERLQNALHESRQQAREAKEAAEKLRHEMAIREARMAEYVKQAMAQKEPQEPPGPGEDADPVERVEWENRQLRERLEKLEQADKQSQEQRAQNDQISDIQRTIYADEQRFMAETPDYLNAVEFAQKQYATVLEIQGYNDAQIAQQLQLWGTQFGASQMQQGKSPAGQFYELAKRLGYQGQQSEAEADPASKKESPLDMIEKGQKQAGLGAGGGDIQKDDDTPDDEFPLLKQAMREVGLPV